MAETSTIGELYNAKVILKDNIEAADDAANGVAHLSHSHGIG